MGVFNSTKEVKDINNTTGEVKHHHKFSIKNPLDNPFGDSFETGKFHDITVKTGSIKFSKLYRLKTWQRYIFAGICGTLMAIIVQFLIKNTGLYNTGLSAVIQGFSRFIYTLMTKNGSSPATAELVFNLLFWIVYFILNIPLFLFSYFKIGKTFTKLTVIYLAFNVGIGFALSSIPHVNEVFIFGRTIPEAGNILTENNVYVLPFYYQDTVGNLFDINHDPIKSFFLFLNALVYGFFSSLFFAILYIIGSCSAGLDFVSIYYAIKKNKNISNMLVIVNSISMVIGATLGSYLSGGLIDSRCYNWQFFFSANIFASFLSIIIFGIFLSRFFPLNKNVKIEVYTDKIKEVRNYLYDHKYTHALTIYKTTGGYSLHDHYMIQTVAMNIELPRIVKFIRDVDPKCLIIATKLDDIDGTINVYQQGSTE